MTLKEEILSYGNTNFLEQEDDLLFCFGDRRTSKTTNMICKMLLNALQIKEKELTNGMYIVIVIVPTIEQRQGFLRRMSNIGQKLGVYCNNSGTSGWYGLNVPRTQVKDGHIGINVRFATTHEQVRGFIPNMIIMDNANHVRNKKEVFHSTVVSMDAKVIVGGDSFYA